jgi:NitT/TauT family transport system substrate-binding protein
MGAVSAVGALLVALTGCSTTPPKPAEVTTLKVAVYGSTEEAIIDIADQQGWLADAGLAVEKQVVGPPPAEIAAVAGDQVDVAMIPTIPYLNAASNSVPIQIVGAVDGLPETSPESADSGSIVVNPKSGITDFAGLKGKTISVPARGGLFEVIVTGALKAAGVDPASVKWVEMDFGAALQAVESGDIDAAPMISPLDAKAIADGMVVIGHPQTAFFGPGGLIDVWVTSDNTATAKHDAILAFRDIMYRAGQYGNEHPDEVKQLGIKIMGVDLKPEQITNVNYVPSFDVKAIEKINQSMIDLGFLTAMADVHVFK